ncbi:MAG: MFS transporter [Rubrivivax sp.]|nr:MFS transporter [Rubrivivax sp.]
MRQHLSSRQARAAHPRLPRAIWVLGGVSMLMDISSELIHSLLPLFLVGSLGISVLVVGLIEGVAEATALIVKVFSGVLSDHLRRRKLLALLGYGLGALSKPAFALAQGAGVVVAARFVDRIGKGIRGAPRDALVADLVRAEQRGAAYGLRQSLDTAGAFIGPLLATALMVWFVGDFRAVFWVATVPAVLAVLLLLVGVREPPPGPGAKAASPIRREALAQLGASFWAVVAVGAVFTLARFSEAFLVLRAEQLGVAASFVPLVMVAMNVVYALSAYPFGRLSDSTRRSTLLGWGLLVLVAADVVLAWAPGWPMLLLGVALWGLHMGMTQGLLAAMVADVAPEDLRGTAFGLFNLVSGVAMLLASAIAGLLWDRLGSQSTFLAGAGFAVAALVVLVAGRSLRHRP